MTSVIGGWLDIGADFVADMSVFIGIACSMLGRGDDKNVFFFLMLCLSGAAIHCALVVLEKIRGFGPAVYGKPNTGRRPIFNPLQIFDALREGDACWLVFIFAVIGKAHTLLWFGGIYMQILWVTAFLLNRRHLFASR